MNRSVLALLIGVAVAVAAGCAPSSSSRSQDPSSDPSSGAPQEQDRPQSAAEWEALAEKLRQQQVVADQQRFAEADEHYRLADRWHQASDFERAELEAQKALKLNPNHLPAQTLLIELQFLLGTGVQDPQGQAVQTWMHQAEVQRQQVVLEIDNRLDNGQRAYNAGRYEEAERDFRTILEYAKWMPTGLELETRRRTALDMLEKSKAARRQKEIDEEKERGRMAEEDIARDELRRKLEQKRELEILFDQAQQNFEKENYDRCIEICDRILYNSPHLRSVDEMRQVAVRLRLVKTERDNVRAYIEEWKRTFELVELSSVVQADELSFAARQLWLEVIAKRRPKGIQDFAADEMNVEDKAISDKLASIRITLNMENAPLPQVVDYLREVSGLNILIDNKAIPDPNAETVSIKVTDITLESALKIMLQTKQKAHLVEDGVVLITSADAIKKKVRLELYDVQDLTYGLQDFPGVDLSLAADAIGAIAPPDDAQKVIFTGEDLAGLIEKTVDKDLWGAEDGKSIQFNNGLLIVRNGVETHKKIAKFLTDLRASTGVLVSVETRFLTVEDSFLQQVGMDFRDLDGARTPTPQLDDINPAFTVPASNTFVDPDGPGPSTATSTGISWAGGNDVQRTFAARVQNVMFNDQIVSRFFNNVFFPQGGLSMQYTLVDDISLEAIIRLVHRSARSHVLVAPKITLFNTQRGNIRISNQFAYIRDFDIQIATGAVIPDPVPDVIADGITLDVRPVVSADRRFVTIELRPTIATLFPAPPTVFGLVINLDAGATSAPFIPGNVFIETPILNVQRMRTTVVVPDRGTLIIGGLTTYFEMDAQSGIPLWRNIPILGNLGSNKYKGLQKKQLLVVLRSRIIIPDEEERRRFD